MKIRDSILNVLRDEKLNKISGRLYHYTQIELTYNSNHIEGSRLTREQTRYIFDTSTVLPDGNKAVLVNDIIETVNHFRAVDYIIDNAEDPLSEEYIKELHKILKSSSEDSKKDYFVVGDYKLLENTVADMETTSPKDVPRKMKELLSNYLKRHEVDLIDLAKFHKDFEAIHPFQDGNGRVGRLILFKECLKNDITPFIITDELKAFYYRGLSEWNREQGYLLGTFETAQNNYKGMLDRYNIEPI